MTCYETLFVIKPTLTDEETAEQVAKVTEILAKEGAELLATNDMGMRKLAYPVEKHARGYYTILFFKAEGTTIHELERNLKINEDVIKFLTIKYTKNKELTQFKKLVDIEVRKATPVPVVETAPVVEAETETKVEEVAVTEETA